jgi:hypothetical protein
VSWLDAIRFCNWLHNGQPTGTAGPATTEDGAYRMDGLQPAGQRRSGAKFFLPTEDEWYKAAYFVPRGDDSGSYRHFPPLETERPLIREPRPGLVSPCGMGGLADRVWEWTESPVGRLHRSVRSGAWFQGNNKQAAGHFYSNPQIEYWNLGFRVARPVEP